MQPFMSMDDRMASIAKIAESKTKTAYLRQHVKEVTRGAAFQGSHRSGQFLDYIVEKALAGNLDSLKERVIGIELFGRALTYDTGEDSIVRVTASDVRKRLLQHYGRQGASSQIRINLPIGSYVPEITWEGHGKAGFSSFSETPQDLVDTSQKSASGPETLTPVPPEPVATAPLTLDPGSPKSKVNSWRRWLAFITLVAAVNLVFFAILWNRPLHATAGQSISVLPWSEFLNSPHSLHLITSDPNIFELQEFTGGQISLPDYANRNYIQEPSKLSPDVKKISDIIVKGDKSASAADPPIAAEIAALAQTANKSIQVRAARNIQFSDLKSDDNFIFLGSPSSDPWSALFSDQLDFRFIFDKDSKQEIIRNEHPRQNELTAYVPTAPGWATGRSYAIIAFVKNPDQGGRALLIAGMNGEGTEAAGKLVTDLPQLTAILRSCGLPPSSPPQDFEMLLQLNSLAGSSHNVEVLACHLLPGSSAQR
jgi:hypothetical protein